jgi:hypothetical protein
VRATCHRQTPSTKTLLTVLHHNPIVRWISAHPNRVSESPEHLMDTCVTRMGTNLVPTLPSCSGLRFEWSSTFRSRMTWCLPKLISGMPSNSLIERILKVLKLSESKKIKRTPAGECLRACHECPPHSESWNYRSVEGMMLYLAINTRPEISMAVHQCARFDGK